MRPAILLRRLSLFLLSLVFYTSFKLLLLVSSNGPSSSNDVRQDASHIPPEASTTRSPAPQLTEDISYMKCPGPLDEVPPSLIAACPSCTSFTCKHFFQTPPTSDDHKKAKQLQDKLKFVKLPDSSFIKLTENCTNYQNIRKFVMHPVNPEEANYSIAFNILMHKEVEQVERLLHSIYRPQNYYCIHVDAKASSDTIKAVRSIARCFPNVFIASRLERVVYAGFSRLQADINCMSDLIKVSDKWKYLINVAGQAFPIKTNEEMVKILKIYNGANDIEGIYGNRVLRSRFVNEWKEIGVNSSRPSMKKTGKQNPPPPFDIDIVRGSAYGIFSRAFVDYLLKDAKPRALLAWSRNTWSPDEHYWATLHHTYSNPHIKAPGSYTGIPNEKPWLAVYAAWGGVDSCHGQWKHGVCVFGLGDLPNLMNRKEFFANKFYYDLQPAAFECMERWIQHKLSCPSPFDKAYYQSLPFIHRSQS